MRLVDEPAPRTAQKAFSLHGTPYVPHYDGRCAYVAPGYVGWRYERDPAKRIEYTEGELRNAGAIEVVEHLWCAWSQVGGESMTPKRKRAPVVVDEREFASAWNNPNLTLAAIAEQFGIHRQTVRDVAERMGLDLNKRVRALGAAQRRPMPDALVTQVEQGWSLTRMAAFHNVTRRQVQIWCKREALPLIPPRPGCTPKDETGELSPGLMHNGEPKVHRSAFDDLPFSATMYATVLRALSTSGAVDETCCED